MGQLESGERRTFRCGAMMWLINLLISCLGTLALVGGIGALVRWGAIKLRDWWTSDVEETTRNLKRRMDHLEVRLYEGESRLVNLEKKHEDFESWRSGPDLTKALEKHFLGNPPPS